MRLSVRFREQDMRFSVGFAESRSDFTAVFDNLEIVSKAPDVEFYGGPYEIVPAVKEQRLETAHKMLDENLVVKEIPYSEVSNLANGLTVTIG